MNKVNFNKGVWPVMITPFDRNGAVDYDSLQKLIEWYIQNGVAGLFSVCQSSEMFFLTLEERVSIAKFVKEVANNRVKVIASGHTSDSLEDQINEINQIAKTGVDAIILISNRLARENENDDVFISNLEKLLESIDKNIPLGFYECPFPYKRVLSDKIIKWILETKRFYFLKDTSCDINNIKMKLDIIKGSNLCLYNANTATLLESLKLGASGYSGVMANLHPDLYVYLCENSDNEKAGILSDALTMLSLIETQNYPINAKYYLKEKNIIDEVLTRNKAKLTKNQKSQVDMLDRLSELIKRNVL